MLPAVLLSRYRFDLFAGAFRASQTEAVRQHAEQSEQYARGPQIRANSMRKFFAEFLVGAVHLNRLLRGRLWSRAGD
jgi:hypothetical protein